MTLGAAGESSTGSKNPGGPSPSAPQGYSFGSSLFLCWGLSFQNCKMKVTVVNPTSIPAPTILRRKQQSSLKSSVVGAAGLELHPLAVSSKSSASGKQPSRSPLCGREVSLALGKRNFFRGSLRTRNRDPASRSCGHQGCAPAWRRCGKMVPGGELPSRC